MNKSAAPIAAHASRASADLGERLKRVSILVIDHEPGMREFLTRALQGRCKRIRVVGSAEEATEALDEQHFDLILLENVLPGISGLDWLREQRRIGLCSEAIVVTAYADLETVICAMRAGASDFLLKPLRAQQLLSALTASVERRYNRRRQFMPQHLTSVDTQAGQGRLLGKSPRIEAVRRTLERVARTTTPVLITGESGTGKEIAARTLHAMSDRAQQPFVVVNCAALSPERFSSALFGWFDEPGGAGDGVLDQPAESTVFLDEIAEMPLPMQAALLRVIDEGRFRNGSAGRELQLNLRFVASTNSNLAQAIEEGRFRRDLYHRINVVSVEMPALRDRVGDIPELTALFMDEVARDVGAPPLPLSEQLLCSLARHDWPGNVRELRNLVEQSVVLGEFPPQFAGSAEAGPGLPVESLQAVERQHILSVLEACGGNRAEAARRLGISRKTIDRKCAMWNV